MRPVLMLLPLAALGACAPALPPAGDLQARQEASCIAAIAAHIGQPASMVRAAWLSESGGMAEVEAIDGSRRHLCRVDGSGRVVAYTHPPS